MFHKWTRSCVAKRRRHLVVTLALCLSVLCQWLSQSSLLGATATDCDAAVDSFVTKEQALWALRRQGQLTSEEWNSKYTSLLESEARAMQPLLPDVLYTLANRLSRSKDDDTLEELLDLKHPSPEEMAEIQSLIERRRARKEIPRCGIAQLTGFLGRDAPGEAVDVLLSAAPPPERADDMCYIGALMSVGPGGYGRILNRVSIEKDQSRLYIAVMGLVAQAVHTDFPSMADLGNQESWGKSFPESRRGLKQLAEKWKQWWEASESKYTWNPSTSLLQAK